MPRVEFQPTGVIAEVPAGTLIHDAAVRAGIHDLELPCGGQGTCGQCLVEVDGVGPVLACQTRVTADIVVRLPENRDTAMRVVGDSHFLTADDALPDPAQLTPLFRHVHLNVPPASIEEHYSDWNRLVRAIGEPVQAPLEVLRDLAAALRADDGRVTLSLAGSRVVEVRPGHVEEQALGLAIDIGTTTIAVQVVDLNNGRVLSTATSYNRQICRGADVITRIDYARTPERLAELRELVLETINSLIPDRDIRAAFIAGNTTMIHLLLGLPPRHIRESPYVPTVNPVPALTAAEVGLAIRPDAVVECAPGAGSYVGGDITAGLLATEMLTNADDVFLFLDIGTNGEIAVGNADWLVACACSAGPAFEGAGVKCGMRAATGAIEQVEIGDAIRCQVIGGGTPEGICGSGLICLLGELFRTGLIDAAGRFRSGEKAFEVAPGIVITESDIENLIRTKAAIYAACALVLKSVGLEWSAISRVYIAGGFGRYLRIDDAITIGMLPDLPHGRFSYIGNSALTGAYIALLSRERRQRLAETAARMTYLDLSSDPAYMDNYVKAMFLPHTDAGEFPSVAQKLRIERGETI